MHSYPFQFRLQNSPAMSKADEKMAVETVETRFLPVFTGNDNTERAPECACPCFTSSLRRRLAKIESFVAVMSMYILFFVSTEMYLMAVITTIEKRFGFNSYQSGMLFSAKEITYFCTVTFVSHFAKKSHRPRLIGVMGYIGVLAGYVSALPHFFFGGGSVSSLTITAAQRSDPMLCRTNDDMTTSNRTTDHCDDSSDSFHVGAYSVFIMSAILLGLSQSCQGALSATYVDDSVTKDKVALYLGEYLALKRKCHFDEKFHHWLHCTLPFWQLLKADSRFAPSQWETALLCNDVSHWLGASLESALLLMQTVTKISSKWRRLCFNSHNPFWSGGCYAKFKSPGSPATDHPLRMAGWSVYLWDIRV